MVANAEKRSRDRYAASAFEIGLKLRRASRCYAGGAYRLPIRWTQKYGASLQRLGSKQGYAFATW